MQAYEIAAGFETVQSQYRLFLPNFTVVEGDTFSGFFLTSAKNISNSLETLLFLPQ
jgi:hypothetical protein